MFVKWKHERNRQSTRWYAYLAKSVRVEGKPRQQIVTYLGSIEQYQGEAWACTNEFWYKVHCSLCLARVDWHTYQHAIGEVGKRVECPPREELIRIIAKEYQEHPRWRKDYEAITSVIDRSDMYFQ